MISDRKKYPRMGLNLGCGPLMIDEVDGIRFVNIDKEPSNYNYAKGHDFVLHDLTRTLLYDEDTIEFINMSQTLEHLNVRDGMNLLSECHRILEPGGRLRITVPDADLLIAKLMEGGMDEFKDVQPWPYDAFKSQMNKYGMILFGAMHEHGETGHRHCYNFEGLKEVLEMAAFRPENIRRDPDFHQKFDAPMAKNHQLAVQAIK